MPMAPTKLVSRCRLLKLSRKPSCGNSSMPGLKMPLSGMVENTTIIHSGNSQISASGVRKRCSKTLRPSLACERELISAALSFRLSGQPELRQRDGNGEARHGVCDRRRIAEIERAEALPVE